MAEGIKNRSDYLKIMFAEKQRGIDSIQTDNYTALGNNDYDIAVDNEMRQRAMAQNMQLAQPNNKEEKGSRNWWQRIWDTAESVGNSLTEGFLSWFDDIGDFVFTTIDAIGGGNVGWAQAARDYDWQSQAHKFLDKMSVYDDIFSGDFFTADYWNSFAQGWSPTDARNSFNNTLSSSYINEAGEGVTNFVRGAENSIGYMIPSMLAAYLTGGGSLAAQGFQAMSSNAASLATMGAGAFAGATSDYYKENGGNYGRAVLGGAANAAVEVGTEMLFQGGGKVASNVLVRIGKEALEEGAEEAISGFLDPWKDFIGGTGTLQDIGDKHWGKDALDFWLTGSDSVVMQGLSGAVTGIIMDAPNKVGDVIKYGNDGAYAKACLENVYESAQKLEKDSSPLAKQEYIESIKELKDAFSKLDESKMSAKQKQNFADLFNVEKIVENNFKSSFDSVMSEFDQTGNKFLVRNKFNKLIGLSLTGNYQLKFGTIDGVNPASIKNGTITIDMSKVSVDGAKEIIHETLGHAVANEIVNDIEANRVFGEIENDKWYEEHKDELIEAYQTNDTQFNEMMNSGRYQEANNYFRREVLANYLADMFENPKMMNKGLLGSTGWKFLDKMLHRGRFLKQFNEHNAARSFIALVQEYAKKYNNALRTALIKVKHGIKFDELSENEKALVQEYKAMFPIFEKYGEDVRFFAKMENGKYVAPDTYKLDIGKNYTIEGDRVYLTENKLDDMVYESSSKWRDSYASSYITEMSPDEFISLTSLGELMPNEYNGVLDEREFTYNPNQNKMFIKIDMKTGKVTSHEGRHRMEALKNSGVKSVPVQIWVEEDSYDRLNTTKVKLTLKGQQFGGKTAKGKVNVELTPLSRKYYDEVYRKYINRESVSSSKLFMATNGNVWGKITIDGEKFSLDSNPEVFVDQFSTMIGDVPTVIVGYEEIELPNKNHINKVNKMAGMLFNFMSDTYDPGNLDLSDMSIEELKVLKDDMDKISDVVNGTIGGAEALDEVIYSVEDAEWMEANKEEPDIYDLTDFRDYLENVEQNFEDDYQEIEERINELEFQEEQAKNNAEDYLQYIKEVPALRIEMKNDLLDENVLIREIPTELDMMTREAIETFVPPKKGELVVVPEAPDPNRFDNPEVLSRMIPHNESVATSEKVQRRTNFTTKELKAIADERWNGKKISFATVKKIVKVMEARVGGITGKTMFKWKGKQYTAEAIFEQWELMGENATREQVERAVDDLLRQEVGNGFTFEETLIADGEDIAKFRKQWVNDFMTIMNDMSKPSSVRVSVENALLRMSESLIRFYEKNLQLRESIKLLKSLDAKINAIKAATQTNTSGKTGKYIGLTQNGAEVIKDIFKKIRTLVRANGVDGVAPELVKEFLDSGALKTALNTIISSSYDYTTDDLMVDANDSEALNKAIELELTEEEIEMRDSLIELAKRISEIYSKFEVNSKRSSTGKETWHRKLKAEEIRLFTDFVNGVMKLYNNVSDANKQVAKQRAKDLREITKETWLATEKEPKLIKSAKAIQGIALDNASPKLLISMMFGGTYEGASGSTVWKNYFVKPYEEQLRKQNMYEQRTIEILNPIEKEKFKVVKIKDNAGNTIKARRYVLWNYYLNSKGTENVRRMKSNSDTVQYYDGHVSHTINTSELDALLPTLSKQEIESLDALFLFYNTTLRDYSAAVQVRNFGFSVVRDNYYPINVSNESRAVNQTVENSQTTLSAMSNNRMKVARNNQSMIEINHDPWQTTKQYIEAMTISGEVGKAAKEFGQILNFKDDDGYSTRMYASKYIDQAKMRTTYLQKMLIAKRDAFVGDKWYSSMVGKWSTATLGFNIRSMLKQFGSFWTSLSKVNFFTGMKGIFSPLAKVTIDGKTTSLHQWLIENNPVYAARVSDHGFVRASTLSNAVSQFSSEVSQKLVEASLKGMEAFDTYDCLMSFASACYEVESIYGYKFGTKENLQIANDMFTDIILETKSNSDRIAMSMIRSGAKGESAKLMFGMFASDRQNKATLLLENMWNTEMLNYKVGSSTDAAEIKRYKTLRTKNYKMYGKLAATLLAAGLWETIANMIADWLYDKKDPQDFDALEELVETAKNSFVDWIPLLGTITNWFDYGEVSIGSTTYLENIITTVKNLKDKGLTKGTFMDLVGMVTEAFGLPFNNVKKALDGIVGNVSPKAAIEMKNLFYGVSEGSMSSSINKYAKEGNARKTEAYVDTYYNTYRYPIGKETAKEIADLKIAGETVSSYSIPKELDGEPLTKDEIKEFNKVYSQTGAAVDKLVKSASYQSLTTKEKASAIGKIAKAYHELAKAGLTDSNPKSRLARMLACNIDISRYVSYMARLSGLEGKQQIVANINRLTGLTRKDRLILAYLMGYGVDSSTFNGLGLTKKQIELLLA